jgi:hypothetical protein
MFIWQFASLVIWPDEHQSKCRIGAVLSEELEKRGLARQNGSAKA